MVFSGRLAGVWSGALSALSATLFLSVACLVAPRAAPAQPAAAAVDPALLAGVKARSIGPAGMSGRIGAIEAVAKDPNVIYVGGATGGIFKSTSGGATWEPVFDDRRVSSIGAIAVFQATPDIVWVGTGEGNPRNSAGVGYGVYRSLDGGRTWTHLGLEKTERIHRIVLHPTDPDVAYVAAMGTAWGENPERGVFKTTDGGKTWTKVLYVDERTGAADLVMDPANPNKLFAAVWQYRRWPWFFRSGGPGSGLYVTHDGGGTWKRLTDQDGLPKGELGRIGLAIARSNPNVVYALLEATRSALLRSDDGGRSWRTVNDSANIAPRPFYYADIRVDPENENRVYNLSVVLSVSEDGGRSFRALLPFARVHPDHHALWIHPEDGRILLDGNDGGVYISRDRGASWRFVENLPFAQFYHISVDTETPYNVYGGLQDNGSWRGPAWVMENGGIRNYHWKEVGFGDGFNTVPDPSTRHYGYAMSQGGFLLRFDLRTGERKDIRPPQPDTVELRFNWNAAIAVDPFEPRTLYYGSQFVHKSTDRGETWTIISPDLTTNDPEKQRQKESGGLTRDVTAAENHTTILVIAPSPVERGVIWVGTDDGNVQLARDGGATWTNVVDRIPGVPRGTWVPHIEASKFDAGTAFVVFDDHRRANWTPYVYKTTDYGRTWTSLVTRDLWGFVHTLEQDPVNPDVLYLGTEFGLYVSLNGGKTWMKWTHGLPTVPVLGLVVHPRDHDLVIGTHGRAAYVLDDVRPLRALAADPSILRRPVHIFEVPPAIQYRVAQPDGYRFTADAMFKGENRPYGALISYALAAGEDTAQVELEILDETGEVIRKMKGPGKKGVNRVAWNLRRDGFRVPVAPDTPEEFRPRGPEVLPGRYTVRIAVGKDTATAAIEVRPDPRVEVPMADRQRKFEALLHTGQRQEVATEAVERLRDTRKTIDAVLERLREKDDSASKALRDAGERLKKRISEVEDSLVSPSGRQGIFRDQPVLARLGYVYNSLASSWDAPTPAQMTYLRQAEAALERTLAAFNRVFAEDVTAFRRQVQAAGFELLPEREPLTMDWKRKE